MNSNSIRSTLAALALWAVACSAAMAQALCPASNDTTSTGVDDGCTTQIAQLFFFPDLGIFRATFTPACHAHDKCYTSLGGSYSECDTRFLSDMSSACSNWYNQWLFPGEYATCMEYARRYYRGVKQWKDLDDPLTGMQRNALKRSQDMALLLTNRQCATTPEATTLFTANHIATIRNTFGQMAARQPTMYEFMAAANIGDSSRQPLSYVNPAAWQSHLEGLASAARSRPAPSMQFAVEASTGEQRTLRVITPSPNHRYTWSLNSQVSIGTIATVVASQPKYDAIVKISGYLYAEATIWYGVGDIVPVSFSIFVPGYCSSGPTYQCQ